jgi:hypothetical protein
LSIAECRESLDVSIQALQVLFAPPDPLEPALPPAGAEAD